MRSWQGGFKKQPAIWETRKAWEGWLNQKVSFDRFLPGVSAAEANGRFLGKTISNTVPFAEDPGAEPESLVAAVGFAPSFASAVIPNEYLVRFDDGSVVKLSDNPPIRPNYPSYRFPQGVMSGGEPVETLPASEIDSLFRDAGISSSAAKVMKSVSSLEGGFDSVNTYDTGYVSVGLIQFACLSKGAGSLGQVLLREKESRPDDFEYDFRKYGLDVTPAGYLVVP